MGSPRSIAVARSSDVTLGRRATKSAFFTSLSCPTDGDSLPRGVLGDGARHRGLPPGGLGVFIVEASPSVRPTRCDWPNCTACVQATAKVLAEWHPF
jgi:hypothetical protein